MCETRLEREAGTWSWSPRRWKKLVVYLESNGKALRMQIVLNFYSCTECLRPLQLNIARYPGRVSHNVSRDSGGRLVWAAPSLHAGLCWNVIFFHLVLGYDSCWLLLFVPHLNHRDSVDANTPCLVCVLFGDTGHIWLLSWGSLGMRWAFGHLLVLFCLEAAFSPPLLLDHAGLTKPGFCNCLRLCSEIRTQDPLLFSDFPNMPRVVFFPPWT